MSGQATLDAVGLFVGLIAAGAIVSLIARRITALPDSVALVLLGLAIAAFAPLPRFSITPELVLAVLVPGLVFEAAYRLDLDEVRRTFLGAIVLAVPGVIISAGVVAIVLSATVGLPMSLAFIVGAIVSATDPVAVIAMFRQLGAPPRLATLVEAESLFNDGTAVVIFTIAVQAVSRDVSVGEAVSTFVVTVAVSAILGLILGVVATSIIAVARDHLVEVAISVALAYGTYLTADRLHQSGIIATVVAGVTLGTYGRRVGLAARTFDALDSIWEFIAFLLTALVFLLIGITITVGQLSGDALPIAAGVVAVLIGRLILVYGLLGGGARLFQAFGGAIGGAIAGPGIELSWLHVLFWSGLRGAIAVALALSLPVDLPDRSRLQSIVFGITLFTLLVQGTTTDLLLRKLGIRTTTGVEDGGLGANLPV